MKTTGLSRLFTRAWLALSLACGAAVAGEQPPWAELLYQEQSIFATASSKLTLALCESDAGTWCLEATSSVASNRESIRLTALPGGRMLERERFSEGSDRRRKAWRYGMSGVTRERREQDATGEWRLTSRRKIGYPQGETAVTDALMLLALVNPQQPGTFAVHGDLNYYRVTVTPAGEDRIEVDARLPGGERIREVDLVTLSAEPLLALEDKDDFSLLGLTGEITIAFDRGTGLPLQLRGRAPRIGMAELNLKRARLAEDSP